jgi:uncharacterized membrane protein
MSSKWAWLIRRFSRELWFRPAIFSLVGLITALFSVFFSPKLPLDFGSRIGADAVDNILNILASSMLAVTTFSLSTMVTAYGAATTNVTPRATTLVVEDSTTQNVLATFIGTFLFSLVGIVALSTGAYGDDGRVFLFLVTLVVIGIIIVTMIRWIGHLSRLGRVGDTIDRVEHAALSSIQSFAGTPGWVGTAPADEQIPDSATRLLLKEIGYLQHLDIGKLSKIAEEAGRVINVAVLPGAFIDPHKVVAWTMEAGDEQYCEMVRSAFTVGVRRSFDQDPRFGLSVLAEIASRALSPAVNDPGTALDVISRSVRLFSALLSAQDDEAEQSKLVRLPRLSLDDLMDDMFMPIARDGASILEIQLRLQKTFLSLSKLAGQFVGPSKRQSRRALERARYGLAIEADFQALVDTRAAVELNKP